jgi:hypothetical protein
MNAQDETQLRSAKVSLLRDRLEVKYAEIKNNCAITTASCDKYAPYLLNMLSSLHRNSPNHPKVYVFDLGMNKYQIAELSSIPWISLMPIIPFASHWRLCWSWKHYVMLQPSERYIFHMDAGNVILRPLDLLFLSIYKNGYIVFDQGQFLDQITPREYWSEFDVDREKYKNSKVFSAGVFGFDKTSRAGYAVYESFIMAKNGWALGWSEKERYRATTDRDRDIIRNCDCFRHDQTISNLTLRKHIKSDVFIRSEKKYLGNTSGTDHRMQFIWNNRTDPAGLIYLWNPITPYSSIYFRNRFVFSLLKNIKQIRFICRRIVFFILRLVHIPYKRR